MSSSSLSDGGLLFAGRFDAYDILAENRITIENTAFYQSGSENSGSNIAPDKPYPYVIITTGRAGGLH